MVFSSSIPNVGLLSVLRKSGPADQSQEVSMGVEDKSKTMVGAKREGNCLCGKGDKQGKKQ